MLTVVTAAARQHHVTSSAGNVVSGLPPMCRCMRAMCAAHLEALLAISDSCGDAPPHPNAARDVLEGIVLAVFWESPALVSDVRLQAAVARCLRHIPEASVLAEVVCGHGFAGVAANMLRICRFATQFATTVQRSVACPPPVSTAAAGFTAVVLQ